MVQNTVARQLLHDLRHKIAAIEGSPERFTDSGVPETCMPVAGPGGSSAGKVHGEAVIVRTNGAPAGSSPAARPAPAANRNTTRAVVPSGAAAFDRALGGGVPRAALSEIYGAEARDAGAVSGFAFALAGLARKPADLQARPTGPAPLLWIGPGDLIAETGFPHAPAIAGLSDMPSQALLFARAAKPLDALWIAGEAAGLAALGAIIVEIRGNPPSLDLTATRRLHRRARAAGRPVFLLRMSAATQPTAAPVRLCVSAAPARPREIFGQPLARSLGAPAFSVTIDKCRANPGRQFILEWSNDEQRFYQRQSEDRVAVVPVSGNRQDHAPSFRSALAFGSGRRRQTG